MSKQITIPKEWLKRLLELNKKYMEETNKQIVDLSQISSSANQLAGFIESAEYLLKDNYIIKD